LHCHQQQLVQIQQQQQHVLQDTISQCPACSQGGELYKQQQQQHSKHAGSSSAAAGRPWLQLLSQELSIGRLFGQLLPAGLHCAVMGVEEKDAVQVSSVFAALCLHTNVVLPM
jgi:hypothetical protein